MFIGGDKTASHQTSRPSHLFCRTTAAWKDLERDECVEIVAKRYYPGLVEEGLALFFSADVLKLQKPAKCVQPEQRTVNFPGSSSSLPDKVGVMMLWRQFHWVVVLIVTKGKRASLASVSYFPISVTSQSMS